MAITPDDILQFWRAAGSEKWWKKDADFDHQIADQFGDTYQTAANGKLEHWCDDPEGSLALIIVLDQFSRNLFRNDAKAFAQDPYCRTIVRKVMASEQDRLMPQDVVSFCYMPLMHSEDLQDQEDCLAQMVRLNETGSIKAAEEHRDIIRRFGRFPHRNTILGRETTKEEQAFVDAGGFKG